VQRDSPTETLRERLMRLGLKQNGGML